MPASSGVSEGIAESRRSLIMHYETYSLSVIEEEKKNKIIYIVSIKAAQRNWKAFYWCVCIFLIKREKQKEQVRI